MSPQSWPASNVPSIIYICSNRADSHFCPRAGLMFSEVAALRSPMKISLWDDLWRDQLWRFFKEMSSGGKYSWEDGFDTPEGEVSVSHIKLRNPCRYRPDFDNESNSLFCPFFVIMGFLPLQLRSLWDKGYGHTQIPPWTLNPNRRLGSASSYFPSSKGW